MPRRRSGRALDGWLNIDKPRGMSSAACVAAVRRITDAAKVGHAGTLDPLATGVLPMALGEATKTVSLLQEARKRYEFTVRWGERRNTDDGEGEVVERSESRPTAPEIEAVLPKFIGSISQVPPAFSAIKIDGKRAYARARRGETVELAPRPVEIDALTLVAAVTRDEARFQVVSGKGMYVRSLARDLGLALGGQAYLSDLVRTAVGPFEIAAAFSLEKLEQLSHSAAPFGAILSIETALADIPALALSADEADRLRNGLPVLIMRPADRDLLRAAGEETILFATERHDDGERVVAMVRADGIRLQPVRVFNL